jgi:hypothetical protein
VISFISCNGGGVNNKTYRDDKKFNDNKSSTTEDDMYIITDGFSVWGRGETEAEAWEQAKRRLKYEDWDEIVKTLRVEIE